MGMSHLDPGARRPRVKPLMGTTHSFGLQTGTPKLYYAQAPNPVLPDWREIPRLSCLFPFILSKPTPMRTALGVQTFIGRWNG